MKNKAIKILSATVTAVSVYMTFGWSFFEMMVSCKRKKNQTRKKWFSLSHTKINHPKYKFEKEYEEGKEWCRNQNMKDCYIKSKDGLILHGSYLTAENAKRIVMLCHGYKGSGFGDFAYTAKFLHENGCNLLFIDERCCGESQGKYITFGAKEQYDIQKWAYYINRRVNSKLPLYLYGESMGAASVLMASGHRLPYEVKGLIADCGFQSMKKQIKDIAANWFHINWIDLLLLRVDLFCRLFAGFRMDEADTTNAMKTNKIPVLFFHGFMDTYVEPINTIQNYFMCQAPKELVIVDEARHLCSAYEEPELYREKLLSFFDKYDEAL